QTVEQAATTTTVTASPGPSVVGQTVTATVTPASPASGTPTGDVLFDFGDGSAVVTAPLVDGVAQVTHAYTSTSGSPYTITAAYAGDADFLPSDGTRTQSVEQAATAT